VRISRREEAEGACLEEVGDNLSIGGIRPAIET
jgi:hypothetical protein